MAIRRKDRPTPEIPLTSTADVAFLLLVFFLVAASNQRDTGKVLDLPGTVKNAPTENASNNVELIVRPNLYALGGEVLPKNVDLTAELKKRLAKKRTPSDRVVLVASDDNVDYQRWTDAMAAIERAGGIPAPQMEEGAATGSAKPQAADATEGEATP